MMQGTIDKSRLILPGLAGFYEGIAPYSYPLIRFGAGAIFMYHGYAKRMWRLRRARLKGKIDV